MPFIGLGERRERPSEGGVSVDGVYVCLPRGGPRGFFRRTVSARGAPSARTQDGRTSPFRGGGATECPSSCCLSRLKHLLCMLPVLWLVLPAMVVVGVVRRSPESCGPHKSQQKSSGRNAALPRDAPDRGRHGQGAARVVVQLRSFRKAPSLSRGCHPPAPPRCRCAWCCCSTTSSTTRAPARCLLSCGRAWCASWAGALGRTCRADLSSAAHNAVVSSTMRAQVLPTDSTVSTSLWDAPSAELLVSWLYDSLGPDVTHEVHEVGVHGWRHGMAARLRDLPAAAGDLLLVFSPALGHTHAAPPAAGAGGVFLGRQLRAHAGARRGKGEALRCTGAAGLALLPPLLTPKAALPATALCCPRQVAAGSRDALGKISATAAAAGGGLQRQVRWRGRASAPSVQRLPSLTSAISLLPHTHTHTRSSRRWTSARTS